MLARAVSAGTDVGAESAARRASASASAYRPAWNSAWARSRCPDGGAAAGCCAALAGARRSVRAIAHIVALVASPSSDAERGGPLTGVPAEPCVQVATLALEVRVESDCALKLAQTLGFPADPEEDPADVRVRVRVCRIHREGPAVGGERFLVPLQPV